MKLNVFYSIKNAEGNEYYLRSKILNLIDLPEGVNVQVDNNGSPAWILFANKKATRDALSKKYRKGIFADMHLKKERGNLLIQKMMLTNPEDVPQGYPVKDTPFTLNSIKKLDDGGIISVRAILSGVSICQSKSGKDYWRLVLRDKTGSTELNYFTDNVEGSAPVEKVVELRLQKKGEFVNILKMFPTMDDPADYVYCYDQADARFDQLMELLKGDSFLLRLAREVLTVHKEVFVSIPAALKMHHAYNGGLVEHTYSVTENAAAAAKAYSMQDKPINPDLVKAGASLHDIGKVSMLNYDMYGPVSYTRDGQLIGHVTSGCFLVRDIAWKMNDAAEHADEIRALEHIILSHHGEPEYGSPVRPSSLEALIVHYMDNMDSDIAIGAEALRSETPNVMEGTSSRIKGLGVNFYRFI